MKLIKKISLVALLTLSIGGFAFLVTDHQTQTTQTKDASINTFVVDPGTGGPGSG